MRSGLTIVAGLVLAGLNALLMIYSCIFATMAYAETLRVRDARPAFEPIEVLQPHIFSQPFGGRHCRYVVEFTAESRLSDANIATLASLNRLPHANTLDLFIDTPAVTDASIPTLASLTAVDLLDVTRSGMSDDGIAELQRRLPGVQVNRRQATAPAVPHR